MPALLANGAKSDCKAQHCTSETALRHELYWCAWQVEQLQVRAAPLGQLTRGYKGFSPCPRLVVSPCHQEFPSLHVLRALTDIGTFSTSSMVTTTLRSLAAPSPEQDTQLSALPKAKQVGGHPCQQSCLCGCDTKSWRQAGLDTEQSKQDGTRRALLQPELG